MRPRTLARIAGPTPTTARAPDARYEGRSLRHTVASSTPLFIAVGLLMMGTGLGSSVLGIRAGGEGFGTGATGLIMSGYYAGFLVGSLAIPTLIQRVGHIRVFAGMASLASAGVLLPVVALTPMAWWALRLLTGLCVAGLFVVTETWLNGAASNRNRGQLLAAYTVVVTGGLALGQLLLNIASPLGFGAFILASVVVSLAVVPIALVSVTAPELAEPAPLSLREVTAAAPLGVVGAAGAGFAGAAVVGFGAVYASRAGLSVGQTSILLFGALGGAIGLQFAVGGVADRWDRRAIIGVGAAVAGVAALAASAFAASFSTLVLLTAIAGGMSFPMYSLSNAHLNDYLSSGGVVAAGARMVLVNGAGAVAGPLVAAAAVAVAGPEGFFYALTAAYAAVAAFACYRMTRRSPIAADDRSQFVALPSGATPAVASLVPDAAEELYPEIEGDVESGSVRLHWRERGAGPPVVLLHDAGSSSRAWHEAALGLADAGHRIVAYDLRGHGASGRAGAYDIDAHVLDLGAILEGRDIPVGALVGLGAGAAVAMAFAAREPTRVSGLVLVSAEQVLGAPRRRPVRRRLGRIVEGAETVLPRRAVASLRAGGTYGRTRSPELHRRLATDLRIASRHAVTRTREAARRAATSLDPERLGPPVLRVCATRLCESPGEHTIAVDDAGYFVPLDQPGAFVDAIVPFLRDVTEATVAALGSTGRGRPAPTRPTL